MDGRRWNLWRALRHDIGRKVTALALALLLWGLLEGFVVDEKDFTLEVVEVSSQLEAGRLRGTTSGVYLVVPDELIVIKKEPFVRLKVKGLADDVADLRLSAVLIYDTSDLGDADEAVVSRHLDRDTFKSPGENPTLTEFRIRPDDVLDVTLARRATLDGVTLTATNVSLEGKPRNGYVFAKEGIRVVPNTVSITGPRGVLNAMSTDPTLLRLAPVNVEDKTGFVVKRVGLAPELVKQTVSLLPAPGTVTVTIPIVPENVSTTLFSVPVHYDNEVALKESGRLVTSKTQTLDLKLIGPVSELSGLSEEALKKLFQLRFDWIGVQANMMQGHDKVRVLRDGLSYNVRVLELDSEDEPRIEYSLEMIQ